MKKIIATLLLLMGLLVAPVATAVPAQAMPVNTASVEEAVEMGPLCEVFHQCGDFTHYSPDRGYDSAIKVTCDWNDKSPYQWISEGKSATCHDTDGFYVQPDKHISCKWPSMQYWVSYDATGWYKITDNQHPYCVVGIDQ